MPDRRPDGPLTGFASPEAAIVRGECPVCGRSNLDAFTADAWDIKGRTVSVVECPSCEVAWQWPISAYDSVANMQICHETGKGFWSAEETEARVMLQARFLADVMAPGRLLDVGGASGAFARAAASLGWDCTVVDPAFSTAELGTHARIVHGSLESLPAGQSYDVVTLWAVIEHVPNYARVFAAAFAQLRPGGKLVMETLNYQSLDRLRTGRGWWGYQIDHRWYLSPGVYRDVALRVGFSDVQILRKVLRRFWQGEPAQIRPARTFLRRLLRRPLHVRSILHEYRAEHRARRRWPEWAMLPLQTIVATKPIG